MFYSEGRKTSSSFKYCVTYICNVRKVVFINNSKYTIMEISKIQQNVPIPATVRNTNSKFDAVYEAVKAMAKGEYLELTPEANAALKNPVKNAVYNIRKKVKEYTGMTFVVKEIKDNKVGVWCTEAAKVAKPVDEIGDEATKGDKKHVRKVA